MSFAAIDCADGFGRRPRYLRLSMTGQCNFRCLYCAPEAATRHTPAPSALTDEEILRVVGVLTRLGVRKVRFTGGEPLLRPGLPQLMKAVRQIEGIEEIAISTNAYLLEQNLEYLIGAGLTSVNISCDTLQESRFVQITHRRGLDRVQGAIAASLAHPEIKRVKINVVVMRGINDDEIPAFVEICANPKVDVRFIEFMPTADVIYSRNLLVPEVEIRARITRTLVPTPADDPTAPARLWAVDGLPGRVGFISTMTHKFCSLCDRIRVTADGRVARCLFAETLLDLRSLLRTGADDEAILQALTRYWLGKPAGHRLDEPDFLGRPAMIAVGG
ncbi:MAG: GTP 3',8-cyclase MoaA [candidate division Zixibacteria bacterium]|nr:GTP 3',8-cyclase MoaA [candidate division Zixibacteria bacterium]